MEWKPQVISKKKKITLFILGIDIFVHFCCVRTLMGLPEHIQHHINKDILWLECQHQGIGIILILIFWLENGLPIIAFEPLHREKIC